MSVTYGVTDLNEEFKRFLDCVWPGGQVEIQWLTHDVVHDQKDTSVMRAAIVDGNDIGVMQRSQNVHFALEARSFKWCGQSIMVQKLHGHPPSGVLLYRAVDDTLGATVNLFLQLISGKEIGIQQRTVVYVSSGIQLPGFLIRVVHLSPGAIDPFEVGQLAGAVEGHSVQSVSIR
jgi:hypothetical protein